ncbi:MAG: divalent metal cation transporter [Euryarchaeota archaeon]|nr:divalent metal cation transporter [Euryarchaeota archaeon]
MDRSFITGLVHSPGFVRIVVFLGVMGPGLITGLADDDAAGIATYSLAGSQFGYAMLWTFIPMTIALSVIQEMGVRMGIVTGKGLAALIREKAGVRMTFFIMMALLAANFGTTLAEFAGISASASILGIPIFISMPLSVLFLMWLVIKGSYKSVERVFLFASVLYLSYIVSGFLAHPDWKAAAISTVVPQISFTRAYLLMLIGLVGTTISPWMQFYIQSSVAEKEVPSARLGYSRLDAVSGSIVSNLVAWFIVVACAATIFTNGIQVNDVVDVSKALVPLAGNYASILFAVGFLNASLFAASILPLTTSYAVCGGLGLERGVSKTLREAPVFFGLYAGTIILSALIISLPNVPLLSILFISQVFLGILLPFVLIYVLLIINDKNVMGEHVNTRSYNYIAWATVIITIGLSTALIITQFL